MARGTIVEIERQYGTAYKVIYRAPDTTGRVRQFTKTFRRKGEAEKFLASSLVASANGIAPANPKMTVGELLTEWLKVYDPPKQSTWLMREQAVRVHLIPGLGHIKLARLDTYALDQFFTRAKQSHQPATIKTWRAALGLALDQAVRWKLITRNPLDDAKPITIPKKVPEHWTPEEAQRFFAFHPTHIDRPLWMVLATCQLRISEALALRWSDIDWERGLLRVERGLSKTKEDRYTESTPKTETSRRTLTVPPETLDALRQHKDAQDARRREWGALWQGHVPGWVFDNGRGIRLHEQSARVRMERAITEAGVPMLGFHGLRHTGATGMARAGVAPETLKKRLGHASVATTLDLYAHSLVQDQAASADAFARRILKKREDEAVS